MKVTSGTTLPNSSRRIDVTLEEVDFDLIVAGMEGVAKESIPLAQKFKMMSKAADKMVVAYLGMEGAISSDYAKQRMREIDER